MLKKLLIITAILLSFSANSETLILNSDNLVTIASQVDSTSVTRAMLEIQKLNAIETNEPILLVLNTPGGSVMDGIDFIRFAKTSRRQINTVTIYAASMGFQIVEALPGKRYMAQAGILMSHRAAVGGVNGQYPGELNSRVAFFGDISEDLDKGVAARAGLSLKEYRDLIHDEYYAIPNKAIPAKFADAEVDLSCDVSVSGTHTETFDSLFGPIDAVLSNCPLITGVISAGFKKPSESNKNEDALQTYLLENKKINVRSL